MFLRVSSPACASVVDANTRSRWSLQGPSTQCGVVYPHSSTSPQSWNRRLALEGASSDTKPPDRITQARQPKGRPRLHGIGALVPGTGGELALTARQLDAQGHDLTVQARSQGGQRVEAPGFTPRAGTVLPESCCPGDDEVLGGV